MMRTRDFHFDLPQSLIAQYPLPNRTDSRLLCYRRENKSTTHHTFRDLENLLSPGDLLVLNDSKVMPARLYGRKGTGGKVEILVERVTGENTFLAHIRGGKSLVPGSLVWLDKGYFAEVCGREGELFACSCTGSVHTLLDAVGHIPLPPYISRPDDTADVMRYQTVFAREPGSVAAPTAGLHFDDALLESLRSRGIGIDYVTLHVGAGTFQPVRSEHIADHVMHAEHFQVSPELVRRVAETRARGNRVIAGGTTALRCLESAARDGILQAGDGETRIFIYPGYTFQVTDGLLTNFHLPGSTLLMLVSAFVGHPEAMAMYAEAITRNYRFFSYGDASLLL